MNTGTPLPRATATVSRTRPVAPDDDHMDGVVDGEPQGDRYRDHGVVVEVDAEQGRGPGHGKQDHARRQQAECREPQVPERHQHRKEDEQRTAAEGALPCRMADQILLHRPRDA